MALAGDHVQVLVDGYNLTGDHNRVSIDDSRKALEAASFGEGVIKSILGQRIMKLEHGGWMNADTARSHPVLNGSAVSGIVSVFLGQNADPAVGDPVYSVKTLQGKYSVTPAFGEVIPFGANFGNQGEQGGWGIALAVPVSFTDTTAGSSVDNGAASSDGAVAHLHVLTAAATDTYSIVVEGSTTGAFGGEETTLGTFTLDASAIGSERLAIAGSIPRYTRWKATRSGSAGDSVQLAVSLMRQ